MIKNLVFFTLLLSAVSTFAQIPKTIFKEDSQAEYKASEFKIARRPIVQSSGVYRFGESEGELDFIVLPVKAGVIIQVSSYTWDRNPQTGTGTWLRDFKTFNTVIVQGNSFTFGKYKGIFVEYKGGEKAILLNGNPSLDIVYGKDTAEVGHFQTDLATYFKDRKYPEVSSKIIDDNYVKGKSKQELKYMRNEVFARYGLIFKSPETAALFRKRYRAWRKDVSMCLTDIEKHNLNVIKAFETK
jgi:hypothetical protein